MPWRFLDAGRPSASRARHCRRPKPARNRRSDPWQLPASPASEHREFDGIMVPTRRRVYPVDPDGNVQDEPLVVAIDTLTASSSADFGCLRRFGWRKSVRPTVCGMTWLSEPATPPRGADGAGCLPVLRGPVSDEAARQTDGLLCPRRLWGHEREFCSRCWSEWVAGRRRVEADQGQR